MASSHSGRLRRALLTLAASAVAAFPFFLVSVPRAHAAPAQRTPVLVELFTSEGCSDCPPADALLARLDAKQFVPGAEAIVLSEHVTYWNHQGWRDPFSFPAMDQRQAQYSRRFSLGEVYTPQMVVDGEQQFVGSDAASLTRALAHDALSPKLNITIESARWSNGTVQFSLRGDSGAHAVLTAALAENATRSEVARGENAGRTLHHVAVVRALESFGAGAADGRPLQLSLPAADRSATAIRLVVFLVSQADGHVIAVAEQMLNR
jgi:hypothetical protein